MPSSRNRRRRSLRGPGGARKPAHLRPVEADPAGRAWINGREVGGTDPRWSHLTRSYD